MSEKIEIIKNLEAEGYSIPEKVKRAFLKVNRALFVPEKYASQAYVDHPIPIGYGQTISAPHMVLIMTSALDPNEGDIVLEIGTGSGYQAAIIAEIVAPKNEANERKGHVYTIERIPQLAEFARNNLKKAGYDRNVSVIIGDGSKGYPEKAPYDRIIVTAAAPKVPQSLISQLKDEGKMVIPIGDRYFQYLHIIEKKGNKIIEKRGIPCVFVPLIGEEGFNVED